MSLWDDIADSDLMDTFSSVATDVGTNVLTNILVSKKPVTTTEHGQVVQQTTSAVVATNNAVPTDWMKNPFGLPFKQPAINWLLVGGGVLAFVLVAKKLMK